MSMSRRLAIVLMMMAAAGCTATRPRMGREDPSVAVSEKQRSRPEGDPAWQKLYEATDLQGERIAPAMEEGLVTLVFVFATWCEHCRAELAVLEDLRAADARVSIVGLNAWEEFEGKSDEARMRARVQEPAPWLRVVRADRATLAALGGVPKIPSLFLFDADGKRVASFKRDERPPPDLSELLTAVQAAAGP
jgi:thiol-disulfide isomerase/thioredoxin